MKLQDTYIMVIETSDYLHRLEANQFNLFTQKLHNGISKVLNKFKGRIISQSDNTYKTSFNQVTDTILCAIKLQYNFKYITPKFDNSIRRLKIGIAYEEGNGKGSTLATRMCETIKDQVVIEARVKNAYQKENKNAFINKDHFRTLKVSETTFLTKLMDYIETVWNNPTFSIDDFHEPLGYSKSQIYRKMVSLTGVPLSTFIKNYRLNKAMHLMYFRKNKISEVAKHSGFINPSYFSKCFKDRFEILPSRYLQQHSL
ncbi:helix-turn-helix domain-containing protein [Seonamhaeicola sediminis]|uniref:Helix-turn-helix domain-containing protein n=1 Tax=Seonamhaeicola sediminis TaxID=2528206 RepID=A0A562YCJ1_9FLAO|nr:AraC family transcriptional regulator [Seonamhaeicola sediminis]TWO31763.1 helix-turn-helix domain-containing protein [Seonamhaeicola sediminis]